ncbi:MBL fold metallo-hydrolase [Cytophagaceae bacterium DM2B3-1]|uniref:MBL fold metallo-hydrolase n=1 Tax=Xanthocytophaga flava TaxID=3048013 RepID=A0ABT7CEI3_9BACT|nr:MBL fold metallo-hydrolase [Xanthocytophaga flavus]MDJ1492108.1 MBL fold metallo-hydrolase [Xanthocytophaga flavus]
MNRRTILKKGLLLGLSATLPVSSVFSGIRRATHPVNNGIHTFTLGKLELFVVTDGHILFKKVQPSFAPDVPANQVKQVLDENFLPDSADLGVNILIIKSGDKIILLDTGCGTILGDSSGWLLRNLPKTGIQPSQITDIVITHGHPDHMGGLLGKNGELTFPSANIHLSRLEYEFWQSPSPDFSKSKMKDEALKTMVVKTTKQTLDKIKPNLHLFEDGSRILDCLTLKIAPGHTPGHTITTVSSEEQELVHVADLVHSPVLVFAHPEWGFDGDTDFGLAATTRKNILEELARSRQQVFSYHLPWPGLGHVRKKGKGFEWVQTGFALPD